MVSERLAARPARGWAVMTVPGKVAWMFWYCQPSCAPERLDDLRVLSQEEVR